MPKALVHVTILPYEHGNHLASIAWEVYKLLRAKHDFFSEEEELGLAGVSAADAQVELPLPAQKTEWPTALFSWAWDLSAEVHRQTDFDQDLRFKFVIPEDDFEFEIPLKARTVKHIEEITD